MAEAQEKLPERLKPMLEELTEEFKEVLKRSGVQGNASILLHTASLYGASRMMAYALGRRCEEQTARVLRLAKEELDRTANLSEGKEEARRRLLMRLAMLEVLIYQTALHCAGLEN
jgi:uncharacterized protein YtpQ (UPF0354 family)